MAEAGDDNSGSRSADGEPPRKRVRKGTKSCWECKRRKVKCQLSTEDVPVCSGCLTRGTTCLSQEYPEERDPSSGTNVGERLGRIEQVLEKLVAKIEQYEEEENTAQKMLTPDSLSNNDVPTPYSGTANSNTQTDTAPFMHLFDSSMVRINVLKGRKG
ncbi:uncharacterized protein LY89DRAFT_583698 [Mollisia scopiformis]|uniref:Zn(2)-C6 fungal-type domain-containing protein n=1 Tax=Mollisia scopiformis TaxID=149040 RepID=A0A194XE88_MOLSC|nr:uncharacterized protein LY89DRAFT_583698 [Mollisia scopiformis]KUJ18077.1 hypothetical protein LY89DRAFT_583698 [Mollisia scopiformis]